MCCKDFVCGVLIGAATAMTVLPMADPIIRTRMMRCGKRALRHAKAEINSWM